MLKVGLTGGIASGKTALGEMFVGLGAHLIQADHIAHELMRPGQAVYYEIVAHFGREILNFDSTVNRSKLAEAAFGSAPQIEGKRASRVEELNRIVHPAVIQAQEAWMQEVGRQDPHAVALVEAALILEAGVAKRFDRLVVVTCSDNVRVARFAARHKIDIASARKEIERRMAAQLPEKEKIRAADYLIDNSGSLEQSRIQVQEIWAQLQTAAAS